ncbi:Far1-related sequence 12-like isoform x2 [Thalictrum thalictroides]|uniref:Far1-related sequence 12-like isoform x2 n=1 Tax=Thalictrum thalictroides TaxID=46969 RepID=A0A7J6WAN7_THATH|nr:Far1-related sequence 12-like isoform x2 [Thalictrum thalictroides]
MNARYVGSCNDGAGDSLQISPLANVWTLKSAAIKFVELGAASTKRLNCAFNIIEEGMEKLSLTCARHSDSPPENVGCDSSQGEKADDTAVPVYDTTSPVEAKDRPAASKMRLGIKQTQKKKRKCSMCKQIGHYTSTCPQGSVIQSETSTNVAGSS